MRDLQIVVNDEIIDIDGETAFGVSFKGFSFNEADKIHLSSSNDFSIPITKKNRIVFGFPDNMNLNSIAPNNLYYDKLNVKVFADGQFLFSGKCYVDSIEESRMNLYLVGGKNFFEELSKMTLKDITDICVTKLNLALDTAYPSGASYSNIISYASDGAYSVWLPYAVGTLNKQYPAVKIEDSVSELVNKYEEDPTLYNLEDAKNIVTEFIDSNVVIGNYKTGHFFVRVKDILDWTLSSLGFSTSYDNRLTTELSADYVRMTDIVTMEDLLTGNFYFDSNDTYKSKIDDKEGKSFSKKIKAVDFFKTIVQEYAIVFDIDNSNTIHFKCFDEIKSNTIKEISINKVTNRKFSVDGIDQVSWIGYASMNGDGSDAVTTGGVKLICNNKNVETGNDENITFSIKRMLVGYFTYLYNGGETYSLDLTNNKSMEEIIIARKDASQVAYSVLVSRYLNGSQTSVSATLWRATQSTILTSGVYDLYKSSVEYPEEIEFDAFLKTHEAINFSSSNYVRLSGVPGNWYIEEISSYNPRLEAQTVKMRAMRIR